MQAHEDTTSPPAGGSELLAAQPIARITRDGVEYVLLGTAHVSRASVEAVREMLATESFDAVRAALQVDA